MGNKIDDLRSHMFGQLDRLSNQNLTSDELSVEIERAKSMALIGNVIVESAKTEVLHLKLTGSKKPPVFLENVPETTETHKQNWLDT